jgi:hydrogenase expression/formation protein HypC
MCLALPVRVVDLVGSDDAVVDLGGIRKQISLALVEDVAVGDYVILHVGYALTKLDPGEAEKTLALFREAGLPTDGSALAEAPAEERAA